MNDIARLWSEYQGTLPNQMNLMLKTKVRQAFIAGCQAMRDDMNTKSIAYAVDDIEHAGQGRLTLVDNDER